MTPLDTEGSQIWASQGLRGMSRGRRRDWPARERLRFSMVVIKVSGHPSASWA